ncbi:type II toxin-antitoxin system RelE/ParE family toxin [Alkalimonas mucilaginosa]|uniref:type II toxin-antitoxin system RelE/ParE family toxin n=1 Tax=Alkalimonas mucilaginosa TaxID=3057676 RepID=UPI0038B2742C
MVKWTAHAKAQLRHIHDYIAQDSPLYAKRVSEAMVQKTMGLDELPRKGYNAGPKPSTKTGEIKCQSRERCWSSSTLMTAAVITITNNKQTPR